MIFLKQLAKKIIKLEAQLVLKKYKPKIIAITGSVGKTSTREAIYLVLSKKFFVRKSGKSFTTELGVTMAIVGFSDGPSTILEFLKSVFFGAKILIKKTNYPEWLILELDADKPGDLSSISSWLRPDILVMTAIGEVPAHIELFSSIENFLYEKRQIIESVKRNGVVVYDSDDERIISLLTNSSLRKISCSLNKEGEVKGSEFQVLYASNRKATGISFDIKYKKENYHIKIYQAIGVHNEYACLLAFGVGVELGVKTEDIIVSLNKYTALPGRMNLVTGIKDTVIVDDSYNSSPIALAQAIEFFKALENSGRKIAVIGDMLELGKYSAEEHKKVAGLLKEFTDIIVTVGLRAKKIRDELLNLGFDSSSIKSFDASIEAGKELQNLLVSSDIVLVKGSQAMRMERVVEEVMRHPEDKKRLLVRQEKEWQER